jgi:catechol 2,3-dioxygenase-like lactoylglutathione lyase family enzyme
VKIHHIGIWSSNRSKTEELCERTLGLASEREYEAPAELMQAIFGYGKPCKIQVYSDGETRIEVFYAEDEGLAGINHFSVTVGDKREFCAKAKDAGADVIEVRRDSHLVYFIRGPGGLLIEIKD